MIDGAAGNALNFGWSRYEGTSCYNGGNGWGPCSSDPCTGPTCDGIVMPQFTHQHANGWNAIIGGQVYRGACYPGIVGNYYFSDNGGHPLVEATFNPLGGSVSEVERAGTWPTGPSSIHADARGELYETTTNGSVYHIEAGP